MESHLLRMKPMKVNSEQITEFHSSSLISRRAKISQMHLLPTKREAYMFDDKNT